MDTENTDKKSQFVGKSMEAFLFLSVFISGNQWYAIFGLRYTCKCRLFIYIVPKWNLPGT
jgi:hypothetical protein